MPEQFTHRAICQLHERGQVIRDHFVSQVLSSNPLGDPAERDLLVYLPPGYERSPNLRYPVVFALAGYSESDASLQNWLPFQPHCLTRNLTLRSSRNTTSANHLAFSTKPPLHGLPFAKKTVSTENAFQEVDSS